MLLEDQHKQVFLAAGVQVQGPEPDLGLIGDVLDGGVGEALLHEQRFRGMHYPPQPQPLLALTQA